MKALALSSIAALALFGCATTSSYEMSEETAARLAEFERTGEMDACLSLRSLNITPLDERHFLVREGVSRFYLNEVNGNCSGAGRANNRLQYRTSLSQLCSNQIISVVDNSTGITVGSCSLNDFERLEKKEADIEE